ncbi:hypothetical protein GCM10008904_00940 [Paraclostridium ghonii]|uniref:RNA polymerase sigma factor (Sigma-70 family) n=1 Tax=Paraclostridium ghonii TaxID=29358 RepID=A0ABU0N558_9FIRM|nr:sigma-70 family RNA polymerase sigma factor [Paeniclostridium ghonii]MDQ0557948.1 RNA polymerase sigma factor (sigma-70 family) [Paeniclostridium ghonii]
MTKIYSLIHEYKEGDKNKILDLIHKFDPLLNKLQRNSNYEDMKHDLVLFLFKIVDEIAVKLHKFEHDKHIISYIEKSMKNRYIHINKQNQKIYNCQEIFDNYMVENQYEENFNHIIFNDIIKDLTSKEKYVIHKVYFENLPESHVAEILNVSRQAIYKTKTRALNKLKRNIA